MSERGIAVKSAQFDVRRLIRRESTAIKTRREHHLLSDAAASLRDSPPLFFTALTSRAPFAIDVATFLPPRSRLSTLQHDQLRALVARVQCDHVA